MSVLELWMLWHHGELILLNSMNTGDTIVLLLFDKMTFFSSPEFWTRNRQYNHSVRKCTKLSRGQEGDGFLELRVVSLRYYSHKLYTFLFILDPSQGLLTTRATMFDRKRERDYITECLGEVNPLFLSHLWDGRCSARVTFWIGGLDGMGLRGRGTWQSSLLFFRMLLRILYFC